MADRDRLDRPRRSCPASRPSDLDGSLYELLARRYRIVPGSARVTIEPVLPDAGDARGCSAIPDDQACLRCG